MAATDVATTDVAATTDLAQTDGTTDGTRVTVRAIYKSYGTVAEALTTITTITTATSAVGIIKETTPKKSNSNNNIYSNTNNENS